MPAAAKVATLPRPIPAAIVTAFEEARLKEWSDWTPPVRLRQEDVDTASRLFDDRNPIHSADSQYPIAQGTLTFGSLTRYIGDAQSLLMLEGHAPLLKRIMETEFLCFVPVGASIQCSYKLDELQNSESGPLVMVAFKLRLAHSLQLALSGRVALVILPVRVIHLYARQAHSVLR